MNADYDKMLAQAVERVIVTTQRDTAPEKKYLRTLAKHETSAFTVRIYDCQIPGPNPADNLYYFVTLRDYRGLYPHCPLTEDESKVWVLERKIKLRSIGINYMDFNFRPIFFWLSLSQEIKRKVKKSEGVNNANGVVDFAIQKDSPLGKAYHPSTGLFFPLTD